MRSPGLTLYWSWAPGDRCADSENNIIDDFEDGVGNVAGRLCPVADGRGPDGAWAAVDLSAGSVFEFVNVLDGAPQSTRGIHLLATGVNPLQGAGIGLSLGSCYGAGVYDGVSFWARSGSGFAEVTLGLLDALTHGEMDCHGFDSPEPGADSCYGSFRKSFLVTQDWERFTATWGELVQAEWGTPQHAFEANKLVSLVFIVLSDVDIELDDVAFIGGDTSACAAR